MRIQTNRSYFLIGADNTKSRAVLLEQGDTIVSFKKDDGTEVIGKKTPNGGFIASGVLYMIQKASDHTRSTREAEGEELVTLTKWVADNGNSGFTRTFTGSSGRRFIAIIKESAANKHREDDKEAASIV